MPDDFAGFDGELIAGDDVDVLLMFIGSEQRADVSGRLGPVERVKRSEIAGPEIDLQLLVLRGDKRLPVPPAE